MAKNKDKILQQAEKLNQKGKIDAAIKKWQEALEIDRTDIKLTNRLGDACVRIGRVPEAIEYYLEVAEHYAKDGFFLKAIAMLKKSNKQDPTRLDIFGRLGDLYHRQGLDMDAKANYQRLAAAHIEQQNPEEAIRAYEKLLEVDPDFVPALVHLADLFNSRSETEKALEQYARIGELLIDQGKLDEAAQVYQKALQLKPGSSRFLAALAEILKRKGDHERALAMLEKASNSAPTDTGLLLQLGKAYGEHGRHDDAERMVSAAAKIDPSNPDILDARSDLAMLSGNAEQAWKILGPAADLMAEDDPISAVQLIAPLLGFDSNHIPTLDAHVRYYEKAGQETAVVNHKALLADAVVDAGQVERGVAILEDLVRLEPSNSTHQSKLDQARRLLQPAAVEPSVAVAPSAVVAPPPERPTATSQAPPAFVAPAPELAFGGAGGFLSNMDGGVVETTEQPAPIEAATASQAEVEIPLNLEADEVQGTPQIGLVDDFVSEHLTEAEVFAKYGLLPKAIEHFEAVLGRVPTQMTALKRLVDLYIEEGREDDVRELAGRLAECYRDAEDGEGLRRLGDKLRESGITIGASASPPEVDETDELEDADDEFEIDMDADDEFEIDMDVDLAEPLEAALPATDLDLVVDSVEEAFEIDVDEDPPLELDDSDVRAFASEGIESSPAFEFEATHSEEAELAPAFDFEEATEEEPTFDTQSLQEVDPVLELGLPVVETEPPISFEPEIPTFEPEIPTFEPEIPSFEPTAPIEEPEDASTELTFEASAPGEEVSTKPATSSKPAAAVDALVDLAGLTGASVRKKKRRRSPSPGDITEQFLSDLGMAPRKKKRKKAPEATAPLSAEQIGEVDFYLDQGLIEEARQFLGRLEESYPGDPSLIERRARIDAAQAAVPAAAAEVVSEDDSFDLDLGRAIEAEMVLIEAEDDDEDDMDLDLVEEGNLFEDEDSFFDLASELNEEFQAEAPAELGAPDLSAQVGEASLQDVFREFKKGVEQQLGAEDYDTHYNLGIAYKEMGLTDEAIGEFQISVKDPKRAIECCSMLGLCFLEKGHPQLAIKWYQKGLANPDITEVENLGLLYDLALVYQELGDLESSYASFVELYGISANYRDVSHRIRELEDVRR